MQRKPSNSPAPREELRAFLKSRRARIQPEEVGVRALGHRRVPGLTREDVAHLAGVSFKWYGRFESGMAAGVSRRFLERISVALRLNNAEKRHLYGLAGFADPGDDEDANDDESEVVEIVIQ